MGFFKKLGRGLRKTVGKKLLSKIGRVGLGIATGGLSEKAIGVAKTIRGQLRGRRTKGEDAVMARLSAMSTPKLQTTASATRMPGGAPLVKSARAGVPGFGRRVARRVKRTRAAARQNAPRSKRKPPTGGKDLKALSVSWKAAGKPGRWIDWVKSH